MYHGADIHGRATFAKEAAMIILPNPVPTPPTDYEGAFGGLKPRTKLRIAIAALVPVLVAVIGLALGSASVLYAGFVLAFPVWGAIGAYLSHISDKARQRRRNERRQFHALAGAELTESERRDALYEAQRRRMVDAVKQRREQ
jgi:hypothetical protein